MKITSREAAREVRQWLSEYGLVNRVTARRVDFTDLARADAIIVTIHDWQVDILNDATPACVDYITGHADGYIVRFTGPGIVG